MAQQILRYYKALSATIASGDTTSTQVDGRDFGWFGIVIPASFSGTSISFLVSHDALAFQPLFNAAGTAQVTVAVTQGRSYDAPSELTSWAFWQIVSNAAEAGARTLKIAAKG